MPVICPECRDTYLYENGYCEWCDEFFPLFTEED